MKLLLIMLVFLCADSTCPRKEVKKPEPAPKKEVRSSFRLAPSILIINY